MSDASVLAWRNPVEAWHQRLRFPKLAEPVSQDAECCEIREGEKWRRLRFHDYAELYERPGLYEYLFYDVLKCDSPRRVVNLLAEVRAELCPEEPLRVVDFGAGNGMVGRELRRIGARRVVGMDILEEARAAACRDLPGVYDEYLVADMTDPPAEVAECMRALSPNVLTCVAALGFGDIPPRAWHRAASFIAPGGLLAFNIKEDFLDARYTHGFSELVRRMIGGKVARVEASRRYCHRLSVTGEPLYYTAMVVTKLAEIPESMLVD
ncbi:MAG TPA: class I SAM-dependent methyltransferase [Burkholderiales bacterium]|nr:class I SAM-dependent methyltransferase [Burkholderiales bacterium]